MSIKAVVEKIPGLYGLMSVIPDLSSLGVCAYTSGNCISQGTRDTTCHLQVIALESGHDGPKTLERMEDENKHKVIVLAWTERSVWLS